MKKNVFPPKEIWLTASVVSIFTKGSQIALQAACAKHNAETIVHSRPFLADKMNTIKCFAKGIINSSGNILICLADGGFAPVGKETGKSRLVHGVSVFSIINDLSRDVPPEYVRSKADAEKLCILGQVVSCRGWTVEDVAKESGIDCSRLKLTSLQNLLRAVQAEVIRAENAVQMPKLNDTAIKMII